ncbi:MAG: DUF4846 domain-containing protein [Flavobacteriaceae bacterium]|nr:DUF4846 domain-containing protein [Flavobacteriaceae bacterium]
MKKTIILSATLLGIAIVFLTRTRPGKQLKTAAIAVVNKPDYINKEGKTVKDRVTLPEGYSRVTYPEGSFQEYVRNYKLKDFGAKVINYDGSEYGYQSGHIGVLEIPVPENGLQQCADALIRIRAEYLWDKGRKDEIGFNFTSGHYCSWKQYAEGYRPKIKGSTVTFHKTASPNNTKANFYKYLNLIYMYSGTISLYHELSKITTIEELQIGDMLIYAGSPGHVIMIADAIQNDNGEKRFIMIQGNTPAQSVHMLKSVMDTDLSPWYEFEIGAYTEIPTYYFDKAEFVRFKE